MIGILSQVLAPFRQGRFAGHSAASLPDQVLELPAPQVGYTVPDGRGQEFAICTEDHILNYYLMGALANLYLSGNFPHP